MHYYQFNIGDYRKDTVHLSPLEHYIYRSLIDWYYLDEKPIPKETQGVLRRLGLGLDGLSNLQNVLDDFFENTEKGWTHKRIDREISAFQDKRVSARENGKKGGRPKKQQLTEAEKPRKTDEVFLANPTETPSKPNHKPITNNQEPSLRASANAEEGKPAGLPPAVNGCPYQKILDIYHEKLPMLPRVRMLTDNRKTHIKRRWQNEFPDLDTWAKFFTDVSKSKFLIGQAQPPPGRRPFQADIDWLLKPSNIAKVAEGKYDG